VCMRTSDNKNLYESVCVHMCVYARVRVCEVAYLQHENNNTEK